MQLISANENACSFILLACVDEVGSMICIIKFSLCIVACGNYYRVIQVSHEARWMHLKMVAIDEDFDQWMYYVCLCDKE